MTSRPVLGSLLDGGPSDVPGVWQGDCRWAEAPSEEGHRVCFLTGRTEKVTLSEVREEYGSLERSDLPREEMLVLICVLIWG